jgi:phage/plasmid-like protein (TIGR03299 family)
MAHNIEIREINGVNFESFVAKQPAWHNLGHVIEKGFTAQQAIEFCNANYEVQLQPIAALTPSVLELIESGSDIPSSLIKEQIIKTNKATMRMDFEEVLGVVSNRYGIVQNSKAFEFIDVLTTGELGSNKPTIEAAGVLGHGERIFITAKYHDPIRIDNNEANNVEMFVVFTTSHDGKGSVSCMMTPTRVVCQNTLNLAFKDNKAKFSHKHTKNVSNKFDVNGSGNYEMAQNALKLYNEYRRMFEEKLNVLSTTKLTDFDVKNLFGKIMLSDKDYTIYKSNGFNINRLSDNNQRKINIAMDVLESGVGQREAKSGTALWAINALTTLYQNHADYKSEEIKFDAITNGSVAKKLNEAVAFVDELV